MVHYYQGDNPTEVLEIEPATIDLADYSTEYRNLSTNPSAEVDMAGWSALNVGTYYPTMTREPAADAAAGSHVLRVTFPTPPPSHFAGVLTNPIPAAPNTRHRVRARVRTSAPMGVLLELRPYGGSPSYGPTVSQVIAPADGWVTLTTQVDNISAPTVRVLVREVQLTGALNVPAAGTYLEVDGLEVTNTELPEGYADGNTYGWAWDGAPGASTSRGTVDATATAVLESPAGAELALPAAITTSAEDGERVVRVTMRGPLTEAGMHRLVVTVAGPAGARTLAPIRVPVEAPDGAGWYTLEAARADWSSAPEDDARLFDLLETARGQVVAYAPPPADPLEPPPPAYRQAQLMQARNIWNAAQTDPSATTYGGEGFSAPVYPLDWSVRQMIRPRTPTPRVG